MKKKLFFLTCVLLVCCMHVLAQHRSEQEAMQIAQEFFMSKHSKQPMKLAAFPQAQLKEKQTRHGGKAKVSPSKHSGCYVINDIANNRFVIISSDNRMHKVLGYSDNGIFDAEDAPTGLLEMIDCYDAGYEWLLSSGIQNTEPYANSNKVQYKAIEPLLKSTWSQETPYNDQCPYNNQCDKVSAAGCVAIAMAQVMNYFQYPTTCQGGTYTYKTRTQKMLQSMDFNSISLDWSKIKDSYNGDETEEEKAEVAKLVHACGVAVTMDYGEDVLNQSGAYGANIAYGMINHFGYNPNLVYKERNYYRTEEWDEMIMRELEAKRPIIYSGSGTGGHEFVLDGCTADGFYHFNFGWGGQDNGYFLLDALVEPLSDAMRQLYELFGLTPWNYSQDQTMVIKVAPESFGTREDIFYTDEFNAATNSVSVGGSVKFSYAPTNYASCSTYDDRSNVKFNGVVGIGVFDGDFNFVTSLTQKQISLKTFYYYDLKQYATFPSSIFKEGTQYYIAPYAKADDSDSPTRIRSKEDIDYYRALTQNGIVTLNKDKIEYPLATGPYSVTAYSNGKDKTWTVTLAETNDSYLITNLDPLVADANAVKAKLNDTRTQLLIDANQQVGENTLLKNISGGSNITIKLMVKDGTMVLGSIEDVWGSVKTTGDGETTNTTEVSRYEKTSFSPNPIPSPEPPVITINKETKTFELIPVTEGSTIHYTLDGTNPDGNSTEYKSAITLSRNCTVKAIAIKDGMQSSVAQKIIADWFVVSKPTIAVNGAQVSMSCATDGAVIYYTDNGKEPTKDSKKYEGIITNTKTTTYKAFAVKDGYTDSPVQEIVAPGPDVIITITDNVAGNLSQSIMEAQKLAVVDLTVSGNLNGTDIKLIREMLQNGALTSLDLKNANIVEGGEPYYVTSYSSYSTTNNVIGQYMFEGSKSLQTIKLPSHATKMQGNAVYNCGKLTDIELPNDLESLESFALDYCNSLEKITLPEKVKELSVYNLNSCKMLKEILVAESNPYLKSIDGVLYTQDEKSLLKYPMGKEGSNYSILPSTEVVAANSFRSAKIGSVEIPISVKEIGSYAFAYCANITNVVIPNSVSKLGSGAFENCKNLLTVTMSSSVSRIESFVFAYCVNLREFFVGKAVSSIDEYAFNNCNSLQRFDVDEENAVYSSYNGTIFSKDMKTLILCPRGLYQEKYIVLDGTTTIGKRAFADCKNIEKFILPESVTAIESYAFSRCTMKTISLSNSIEKITDGVFAYCDSLQMISFPEGLKRLEDFLCTNCNKLSYAYIPSTIRYIGLNAFGNCRNLTTIYCNIKDISNVEVYSSSFSPEEELFETISDTCTWKVPAGCEAEYKAQKWWRSTWRIEPVYENILLAQDINIAAGQTSTLNVEMKNDNDIRMLQFELRLPEGVSVAYDESEEAYLAELTDERGTKRHVIDCAKLKNGNYQFVVSTMTLNNLKGHDGVLARIIIKAEENVANGDYDGYLSNTELTAVDGGGSLKAVRPNDTPFKVIVGPQCIPGDVNGDGNVTITDAGLIVNYILGKSTDEFNDCAADVNKDGSITITDAGEIVRMILGGGNAGARAMKRFLEVNQY